MDHRLYFAEYQRSALKWWNSLSIDQMRTHELNNTETMSSPATPHQITWLYFELQEPTPEPTIPVSTPATPTPYGWQSLGSIVPAGGASCDD